MIMGQRKEERGREEAVNERKIRHAFENGVREFSDPGPKTENTLPTSASLSGGCL